MQRQEKDGNWRSARLWFQKQLETTGSVSGKKWEGTKVPQSRGIKSNSPRNQRQGWKSLLLRSWKPGQWPFLKATAHKKLCATERPRPQTASRTRNRTGFVWKGQRIRNEKRYLSHQITTHGKKAEKTTRLKTNPFLWLKKANSEGKPRAPKSKPRK